jgi:hypothetical protein
MRANCQSTDFGSKVSIRATAAFAAHTLTSMITNLLYQPLARKWIGIRVASLIAWRTNSSFSFACDAENA